MKRILISLSAGLALGLSGMAQAESLLEVYQLALQNDAQYRAAEYQYQASQQDRPLARSALLPQIVAQGGLTESSSETKGHSNPAFNGKDDWRTLNGALNLNLSLYHHDQWMALKQADASVAEAEARYKAAQQDLILRVAEAYFGVLAAEDNLRFATAEKEAIARQLEQSQKRFEVGLIAITDVKESQASYDAAVAAEINARNQVDIAREALSVITKRYIDRLAPLSDELPLVTPQPDNIQAWVEQALAQNLDFLAAQFAAKAAGYEVKKARAGHYPYLDLVASYSYSDLNYNDNGTLFSGDREKTDTNLGVQLTFPLYTGGAVSAKTSKAAASYSQALENLEFVRRQTVQAARSSYLNVKAGISQVQAFRRALESTRTAAEATQAGFEVGTRTAVDVLLSLRSTFQADRDYAKARYNYILDYLRLKRAAGTLTEQDLRVVDDLLVKDPAA